MSDLFYAHAHQEFVANVIVPSAAGTGAGKRYCAERCRHWRRQTLLCRAQQALAPALATGAATEHGP